MATLPISDARFDSLYSKKTGVARKKLDDVRDRRANVAKHHLTEEGIFGSNREPRGRLHGPLGYAKQSDQLLDDANRSEEQRRRAESAGFNVTNIK